MGGFILIAVGLPVIGLAWVGSLMIGTHFWAEIRVNVLKASTAEKLAAEWGERWAQAELERRKRGY